MNRRFLGVVLPLFYLTFVSCSSNNPLLSDEYSYRIVAGPERSSFEIINKPLADIKIDLNKKVFASSGSHKSIKKAKEEAYYNAIINNNIHIVVDPIYKTKTRYGLFGLRSTAEIAGYAGYYENIRYEKALTNDMKLEQDLFEMRFKNIELLSKISSLNKEETNTFMIDSKGSCCEEKNNKQNGSNFGDIHLLNTSKNSSNVLIEEYHKLINESTPLKNKKINFGLNGN